MLRSHCYILRGKTPVFEPDFTAFAVWHANADLSVARTYFDDGTYVSTAFLGIDHGTGDVPILFETMIFGGPRHGTKFRVANWQAAERMHAVVVELAQQNAPAG